MAKGILQENNDSTKEKAQTKTCEEHRTISLISHASKIILRIIKRRSAVRAMEFIGKSQFGFRKGCGTREAIGMFMTIIIERQLNLKKDIYACFIDFEKAFDRVDGKILMDVLRKLGIDWKNRRLIKNLYLNQEVPMRTDDMESEPAIIGRGVR